MVVPYIVRNVTCQTNTIFSHKVFYNVLETAVSSERKYSERKILLLPLNYVYYDIIQVNRFVLLWFLYVLFYNALFVHKQTKRRNDRTDKANNSERTERYNNYKLEIFCGFSVLFPFSVYESYHIASSFKNVMNWYFIRKS